MSNITDDKFCRRCKEKYNLIVVGKLYDYLAGSPNCDEHYWVCKTCLTILDEEFENGR